LAPNRALVTDACAAALLRRASVGDGAVAGRGGTVEVDYSLFLIRGEADQDNPRQSIRTSLLRVQQAGQGA
jgi:hypothetical protein